MTQLTHKREQNSYYDFVNNNLSYLYDLLDKFITKKSLSGELIDDKDFLELRGKISLLCGQRINQGTIYL